MEEMAGGPSPGLERAGKKMGIPAGKRRGGRPPAPARLYKFEDEEATGRIPERASSGMRGSSAAGTYPCFADERSWEEQRGLHILYENLDKSGRGFRPVQGRHERGEAILAEAVPFPLQGMAGGDDGHTRSGFSEPPDDKRHNATWTGRPLDREPTGKLRKNVFHDVPVRKGIVRATTTMPDSKGK